MHKALNIPERPVKPRENGITAITDIGIPLGELVHILDAYHGLVDIAKLGIGTAYLEPRLDEKIALYTSHGIPVYFGGTLFEKYFSQDKLEDYLGFLDTHGIGYIEISSGTISIPTEQCRALIRQVKKNFTVLVEVGKKERDPAFTPDRWRADTCDALDAGSSYVILEGRNTADAGIYNSQGIIDKDLVDAIVAAADQDRLIFEAPTPTSQSQLINLLGANVNLGNIFARDLLLLETQRVGLREETFFIS